MKKGDVVECVDAKEVGIPLIEGKEYTLACDPFKYANPERTEIAHVKAVRVVGDGGVYMVTRFQPLSQ